MDDMPETAHPPAVQHAGVPGPDVPGPDVPDCADWPESALACLRELATAYGVATEYVDWQHRPVQVGAATLVGVLRGFGVAADNPAAVAAALAERRLAPWRRLLPPIVVTRAERPQGVPVHLPHGRVAELWIEREDGAVQHGLPRREGHPASQVVDGHHIDEVWHDLPADLPLGWHRLHVRVPSNGPVGELPTEAVCPVVVVPDRLRLPGDLDHRRGWGFTVQLYSARSRRSWGVGDLADLADLAAWSGADLDASFVLVNPLHAHAPVPPIEPSPYLPTSRTFADPLYLRVEAIPEYAYLAPDDRARCESAADDARQAPEGQAPDARASDGLVDVPLLDRDRAWTAKDAALRLVHRVPRSLGREAAYRAFLRREGEPLRDFATWCVLAEEHGPTSSGWPAELRDPRSAAVARFRERHGERIDYHSWLQWQLDQQLTAAHRTAREAGMRIGVMHDLAVGVHPDGADTWLLGDVLATDTTVGAPPDAYTQVGQDWSQPPWRPDRLAEAGYEPFRRMVAAALRRGGGLRVDHVMGMFRLWWVPAGLPPSQGAYVHYDHEAMVGILALEAHRAGTAADGDAVVVGEDLGTVEPWVRDHLAERGILGTTILWFEQDADGAIRPERWRTGCLASVTTHDLPPTRGLLAGDHVELRNRIGLLTRSVAEEMAEHEATRGRWLGLLDAEGLLPPDADDRQLVEAFHRLLVRAPSRLLGVSLTDAVGDRRTQNLPGTSTEYPNWRIPLGDQDGRPAFLEDLVGSARLRSLVECVRGA